jgi:AcrR family transcriptional regulator
LHNCNLVQLDGLPARGYNKNTDRSLFLLSCDGLMQQRSEETRHHILEASQRLFSLNGYDATGVAEICQAAGVSKGAFYHHFPSKQAVFLELLESWLKTLDSGLTTISQSTQDVPSILLQMTEILAFVFQTAEGQLPLFLEYWLHASRDEAIWEATIAPYQHYLEFFTALVQRGIDENSFRNVEAQVAAQTLVALAVGLLLQQLLNPHHSDWPQLTRRCMQLILENMTQKSIGMEVV